MVRLLKHLWRAVFEKMNKGNDTFFKTQKTPIAYSLDVGFSDKNITDFPFKYLFFVTFETEIDVLFYNYAKQNRFL